MNSLYDEDKMERVMNTYYHRPAFEDPQNSRSVFERLPSGKPRLNSFGEPYCVAAALSIAEADKMVMEHNAQVAKAAHQRKPDTLHTRLQTC